MGDLLTSFSAINFNKIHLLPRFSIQRFEAWDKAVKAYSDEYEAGNVAIMRYAEFGAPEKPITIASAMPTPVAAHKKAARFTEGIPSPKGSGAATGFIRSKRPASPSPTPLHFPSTPTPAQRPVAVVVSSPESDGTPPPGIIVYDESDGSDLPEGLPSYPKAIQLAAVIPVQRMKRPFPLLAYVEEQGHPVSKKVRAMSEPPKSKQSGSDDDLYVSEGWEERNLPPRGKYFKSSGMSTTVQQLLDETRRAAEDEFSSKPVDKKGKGKAEDGSSSKAVDRKGKGKASAHGKTSGKANTSAKKDLA